MRFCKERSDFGMTLHELLFKINVLVFIKQDKASYTGEQISLIDLNKDLLFERSIFVYIEHSLIKGKLVRFCDDKSSSSLLDYTYY